VQRSSGVTLAAFALAACGGSRGNSEAPSNRASEASEAAPQLVTDARMDCIGRVEDSPPGNHDRFRFEDDDGTYGFKNRRGVVVIAPTFRFAYEFKPGGIAAIVDADATFAFIDPSGKVLARAFAFDNGPDYFQEGFARIVDGAGKIGFISDRGVIVAGLRPRFTRAESFCNGMAQVVENGQEVFVDRTGAVVDPMHPPGDRPGAPK
jgi:hypothetical protein